MKNLIAFILILTSISVYGQWQKHISGNGSFTTKSYDLSGFESVGTSISGKITISKSNQFKVSLYCESNLMDYIEIFVKENSLKIQCKKGYSIDSKEIDLKIEMPDLEKLSSAGSADIVVNEGFENKDFKLSSAGSGDIEIKSIKSANFSCSSAGSGNITLKKGEINNLSISSAGSGDIDATNSSSENVKISSAGSGNIKCSANETMKISSAGSGNIIYKGNAKVSTSNAGSGKISKM